MSRFLNPYSSIDWDNVQYVLSDSHQHMEDNEDKIQTAYENGLEVLQNHDYNIQHYPAKGFLENNELIDNMANIPNAEHRNPRRTGFQTHFTHAGSSYEQRGDEITTLGSSTHWQEAMDRFTDEKYRDFKNMTINIAHPVAHTDFDIVFKFAKKFYDYSPYCSGIEVYNNKYSDYEELWQEILKTGRNIYGYSVADPPDDYSSDDLPAGSSSHYMIIPQGLDIQSDEFHKEICRAYQYGRSFFKKDGIDGLVFEKIELKNRTVEVEINESADIKFITENGVEKTVESNTAEYKDDDNVFVRIKCENEEEELLSQAIMLKPLTKTKFKSEGSRARKIFLF